MIGRGRRGGVCVLFVMLVIIVIIMCGCCCCYQHRVGVYDVVGTLTYIH